jgi:hypothetical protein
MHRKEFIITKDHIKTGLISGKKTPDFKGDGNSN